MNILWRWRELLVYPLTDRYQVGFGTEDMDDAYGQVPAAPHHYCITVAAVYDIKRQFWAFLELHANLSGYKASVNFKRLPELVVGTARRLLGIVCDHFYD